MENINQVNSIKINIFCSSKDTIKKSQSRYLHTRISNKGLISRTYQQLQQINNKKESKRRKAKKKLEKLHSDVNINIANLKVKRYLLNI